MELLTLREKNEVKTSNMYRTERADANFIDNISISEKCNYFISLMDKSTYSSVTEQEIIYVLFLDSKGIPSVQ